MTIDRFPMFRRLRRLVEMGPVETVRLFLVLGLVAMVRYHLLILPYQRVQSTIARWSQWWLFSWGRYRDPKAIMTQVNTVSRYVPGATCLTQALAGQVLLEAAGKPAELRLGATRDPSGQIKMHAWLECDGQIVLGESEEMFIPFDVPVHPAEHEV